VSWFYAGLGPDDLVGYGDIEEALDALIAAGGSRPPGGAPAAEPQPCDGGPASEDPCIGLYDCETSSGSA
jgi:hypothetical protein